jgi:hypothetical protein
MIMNGTSREWVHGGRTGLFHFVALRPYVWKLRNLTHLHLFHAIVGAQCNEVE